MLKVPVFLVLHPLNAPVYCHWRIQGGGGNTGDSHPLTVQVLSLPAATKLSQGNIFTPVCDSVNRGGGGLPQCMLGCTPPGRQTPWQADPPPPAGRSPGTVNERPVRILLECILVFVLFSGKSCQIIGFCPKLRGWRLRRLGNSESVTGCATS